MSISSKLQREPNVLHTKRESAKAGERESHVRPRHLEMIWRRDSQIMRCDDIEYKHNSATATEPSHDLAHLIVAAHGSLTWAPGKDAVASKVAEYNAVFVEYFLHLVYKVIYRCDSMENDVIDLLRKHLRWFANIHYAPFPTAEEDAFLAITQNLDAFLLVRLSPFFFDLHDREYNDRSCKLDGVEIAFSPVDAPLVSGKCLAAATLAQKILVQICTR